MTNEERIKADAEKKYPRVTAIAMANRTGYIAGATAELAYMQPVIDAAEKVAKIFAHDGEHQTCAICQLAKALEQWKSGKGKVITEEEAKRLLNLPEDSEPKGMPIPATDPLNPQIPKDDK